MNREKKERERKKERDRQRGRERQREKEDMAMECVIKTEQGIIKWVIMILPRPT